MTDDIVTRLRRVTEVKMYNDLTDELEVVATFTKSDDSLEAADEIERLRQQVDSLSKQLDQAVSRD